MRKTAVLLLNLGGPDTLNAVKPFLYNIFKDPFILPLPPVLRQVLARLIAWIRTPSAKRIYASLGGSSPLLANTQRQADALQHDLGEGFKVFVAMRYWRPRIKAVVQDIRQYDPHHVVVLPLYPHHSTTTTASALAEWDTIASAMFAPSQVSIIRSYPTLPGLITAFSKALKNALGSFAATGPVRVLFSAHGLPQYVVDNGDPYVDDIRASINAILEEFKYTSLDWRLCYQSRIGPVRWLEPSLANEIFVAARDKQHIIVVPLSFVSEHSETLYELDKVYHDLALKSGALSYSRLPTPGIHPDFIAGLVDLVHQALPPSHVSLLQKASCTQRISRIRAGDQVASPMSIVAYVTEGESRKSTHPRIKSVGTPETVVPARDAGINERRRV